MDQPYLGLVAHFGFNFAPVGWITCNGQSLDINTYTALYTLIGTNFGGDGMTSFNVPNLQGRAIIGTGQGAGLTAYSIGQQVGTEQVTLNTNNLPAHTHAITVQLQACNGRATSNTPDSNILATTSDGSNLYGTPAIDVMARDGGTVSSTGNNLPIDTRDPYMALTNCICIEGIFPSRP